MKMVARPLGLAHDLLRRMSLACPFGDAPPRLDGFSLNDDGDVLVHDDRNGVTHAEKVDHRLDPHDNDGVLVVCHCRLVNPVVGLERSWTDSPEDAHALPRRVCGSQRLALVLREGLDLVLFHADIPTLRLYRRHVHRLHRDLQHPADPRAQDALAPSVGICLSVVVPHQEVEHNRRVYGPSHVPALTFRRSGSENVTEG